MNDFSFCDTDLRHSKNHLSSIKTDFGERGFYASVSFCNRCGCCAQDCPTYLLSQEETLSPRGRNQAARLLLERKLSADKNKKELLRLINSCTLCGRCTQNCAGKIPTAQHVLEMRRLLGVRALPFTLHKGLELRFSHPHLFDFLIKTFLLLRKCGLIKLFHFSGFSYAMGLGWLGKADTLLPSKIGEKEKIKDPEDLSLIYLPSLETFYFCPSVFQRTLKCISPLKPYVWENMPTGRFEYVFGSVRKARAQIKKLIMSHQNLPTKNIPVLTDSIDAYIFLKEIAPSLFENYPNWQKKAENFSKCVRFVTDFLGEENFPYVEGPVYLDKGTLFVREVQPLQEADRRLRSAFAENFVQFTYEADMPAFAYSFVKGNFYEEMLATILQPVREGKIRTIVTLSSWNKMEWQRALKKMHLKANVLHISELNR